MNSLCFRIVIISFLLTYMPSNQDFTFADETKPSLGMHAKLATDYLHAVIKAGRSTYSKQIVDRLDRTISLKATENWENEDSLLLPAQFLSLSSKLSNKRGVGMRYRLKSLWAINKNNLPDSEEEKLVLETVAQNPEKPFTWIVHKYGRWYFEGIYPDLAVIESCVSCHNSHPQSPKTDFKLGDVIGSVIIDLPLGRTLAKKSQQDIYLAPELVVDYIHSILKSDRAVYSKYIVDRLKKRNVIQAKENWMDEKALMLPAQFLLSTADKIKETGLGLDFRLISLWAINPLNRPVNEFEKIGLETVDIHPIRPYISYPTAGRMKYFQSVYPDFATTDGCVNCHNSHPNSPRRDFQLGDVMGGMVVTIPIK